MLNRFEFIGRREDTIRSVALSATLLLPPVMQYTRAVGDALLVVVCLLFLITRRDWRFVRRPETALALAFWIWMVACTMLSAGVGPIVQALAGARFFVFVVALQEWVLRPERSRQWLWYSVLGSATWTVVECWQQYLFGVNFAGYPRWLDGSLTGPYWGPTAGPMLIKVFFPAFLPLCLMLFQTGWRWAGALALALAAATMILIGQRMPVLLMALGLGVSGMLFRQVRLPVLLAVGVSVAVLVALPVVSPEAFAHLVLKFTNQMQHFWSTQYALIFDRALAMIQAHMLTGLGWDGYRNHCMDPAYLGGASWLPVVNPDPEQGCTIHPHNYWLQIGSSAGVPGMVLFASLVVLWLWRIKGGTAYRANTRRAALLVTVFVQFWPIASMTSLVTVPNAAWLFLFAGWGLAEAVSDGRQDGSVRETV